MIAITLRVGRISCRSCGGAADLISSISLENGSSNKECSVIALSAYPAIATVVSIVASSRLAMGELKQRQTSSNQEPIFCNGCPHCDVPFEHDCEKAARFAEEDLTTLLAPNEGEWGKLMSSK